MDTIFINAVAFQQDGMWVAQCLEYNFVSFAKTKEELPGVLMRQIQAQIDLDEEDGNEPFFEFERAPAKYWAWYEKAKSQSPPLLIPLRDPSGSREVEAFVFPFADAA